MRKIRTLLAILCLAGVVCACGAAEGKTDGTDTITAMEESEGVTTESVETESVETESAAQEDTEAEDTVVEVESSESEVVVSGLQMWVESLGLTEPTIVIWREADSTGTIIETGGEYGMDTNDRFYLYCPKGVEEIVRNSIYKIEMGEIPFANCVELIMPFEEENSCTIEVMLNGVIYKQEFTLIMAQYEDSVEMETSNE